MNEENAERQAELDRLASLSPSPIRLPSPEPGVSGDIGDSTPGDSGLSQDDASDDEWPEWGGFSDGGYDSEDSIKVDFKIEDNDSVETLEDVDEEINRWIQSERLSSDIPPGLNAVPPSNSGILGSALPKTEPSQPTPAKTELESRWVSRMQLVKFHATADKIADDFLEQSKVKISHRSAKQVDIKDRKAYRQGVKDSKKIDVHRKRIEEGAPTTGDAMDIVPGSAH